MTNEYRLDERPNFMTYLPKYSINKYTSAAFGKFNIRHMREEASEKAKSDYTENDA